MPCTTSCTPRLQGLLIPCSIGELTWRPQEIGEKHRCRVGILATSWGCGYCTARDDTLCREFREFSEEEALFAIQMPFKRVYNSV
jgi:hypothetical protein